MTEPVDLLLLTWNRRQYVEKTLARLCEDPSDFHLHCWDNGSTDGAADVIASCDDPRIVQKHFSPENVMQGPPMRWIVDNARSDVIGKIDDDTLVPPRWTESIAPLVRQHPKAGMIGCWTFWPEDFEENRADAQKKVVRLGEHQILQDFSIGGTAFLVRKELAARYFVSRTNGKWIPLGRFDMSVDGLISGWYFPLLWAEHMDDPRSEHNLMKQDGAGDEYKGLTVRTFGRTPEEYLEWIRQDAKTKLRTPVQEQIRQFKQQQRRDKWNRFRSGIVGLLRR
jgi:hypothetical protein